MFPFLILGVALAIAAILVAPLITRHGARRVADGVVIAMGVLAAGVALFALFTGRGNLTIAALIVLAVSLIVTLSGAAFGGPGGGRLGTRGGGGGRRGRASDIETAWLRMSLDHRSGNIAGEVLQGRFAGRPIEGLSVEELVTLLRECQSDDPQSAQLLEAYLDRVAPGWRGDAGGEGGAGPGPMTEAEALDVLGLKPGASADEIREAHRRMMQEHHPDRGGSTWVAARINQAKELLLGEK